MASVTSLDKDLRKLRLDKYTPAAAKEVSTWIESVLGERLPAGDLLESLKDGVALCKLINLAVPPPGVKFKKSAMPFVQMENISHFLRACKQPPLNLQEHDVFLTVDLFEQKDPAQVLQCLGAFSRAAHNANSAKFPAPIGGKVRGVMSPQGTGRGTPSPTRSRGFSNASGLGSPRPNLASAKTGDSGRWSPTKPTSPTTSWSKKEHEGATSPAWNIAQYGYMGGASQGNLGISFGSRRQITSAGPNVPNLAEKEKRRKEKEAEEERQRQQLEEEKLRRQQQIQEEEERARKNEELAIQREMARIRDEEKRQWEEEERQWKLAEENRRKAEEEAEARLTDERSRTRSRSDARLRGQFLSQYQAEEAVKPQKTGADRIAELEAELEKAREREREYERERQGQGRPGRSLAVTNDPKARLRSRSRPSDGTPSRQDSWSKNEREVLQTAWIQHQEGEQDNEPPAPPPRSPRPLPDPLAAAPPPQKAVANTAGGRPLPDPTAYKPVSQDPGSRTDRFLAKNTAPSPPVSKQTYSRELGLTKEQDSEDRRRTLSQTKTKAGGWASKSLLEREMEMERQRQREWEEAQAETAKAVPTGNGVDGIGGGIDGRWDVSQWAGYTGGDNQNRGAQGIGAGRRQIVGPRPLPNPPR
ncbi:Transgelin [Colletotrichum trifolii]|uniref:Transgelin n=1 Tax=Colletotrichum trifolii TaxID=5466 RepID=A0A4R8RU14_COLTR|nr:Transgelin [Colletotrichum trifolii]